MRFDNVGEIVQLAFFMGMGAGLLLSVLLCAITYRWSMAARVGEAAARIAENSRLQAEISVNRERLERGRAALAQLFEKTDAVEASGDRTVQL